MIIYGPCKRCGHAAELSNERLCLRCHDAKIEQEDSFRHRVQSRRPRAARFDNISHYKRGA
jgi:hypothetical protein